MHFGPEKYLGEQLQHQCRTHVHSDRLDQLLQNVLLLNIRGIPVQGVEGIAEGLDCARRLVLAQQRTTHSYVALKQANIILLSLVG